MHSFRRLYYTSLTFQVAPAFDAWVSRATFPEPDSLRCLRGRRNLCSSVVVAFASWEIATLWQFDRLQLEVHVRVDALGMAALAWLGTIVFHGSRRPARANAFDLMRGIVLDLSRKVPSVLYLEKEYRTGPVLYSTHNDLHRMTRHSVFFKQIRQELVHALHSVIQLIHAGSFPSDLVVGEIRDDGIAQLCGTPDSLADKEWKQRVGIVA